VLLHIIKEKAVYEGDVIMDNVFFIQVGNNIQSILSKQDKSQQFLADCLGISKQVMSKIISGSKAINVLEIDKIAKALNVTTDSLLENKNNTEQNQYHYFAFMGKVKNEDTKKKIDFIRTVIDEILLIEDYVNV
jgi:transcriptional regulator with XRE-family HTH domain